ncbi:hypothetical protein AGR13a_Cc170303 [Agrobacterium genomosp. 13 str. CFBP 6927]|uniref:Secreted protein n=2 Tax=Agrobacterium genomosp. 13 TaxID=1183419 RepID=A0ABM9VBY8_9HYPH|nr:hypothetical protein AGR13a_Cc170303 [Agrobacterium genomosp. 13 str. CFBP 6927]
MMSTFGTFDLQMLLAISRRLVVASGCSEQPAVNIVSAISKEDLKMFSILPGLSRNAAANNDNHRVTVVVAVGFAVGVTVCPPLVVLTEPPICEFVICVPVSDLVDVLLQAERMTALANITNATFICFPPKEMQIF